jgi:hypothetical protein
MSGKKSFMNFENLGKDDKNEFSYSFTNF